MRQPVVFVGSFREGTADGAVGGQMHACRTLIGSELSRHVEFLLLDSTMMSVPPPGLIVRGLHAARRTVRFLWLLARHHRAAALVFSGDGPSFLEKGTMVLIGRLLGRTVIFCPRSGMILDDISRSGFYRWYLARVLRAASRTVCQGSSWRTAFLELEPGCGERLSIIANWIDAGSYRVLAEQRRRAGATTKVLYMGWLERYKGIEDLLAAVHEYRSDLGAVRFIICGEGSLGAAARDYVESHGLRERVEFRGWVTGEAKTAALAEADLLVLPSRREGMPNVVLEAMASGLPVVATRVGAVEDTIEEGVQGLLVDPGDVHALGAAIARVCSDARRLRSMGAEAQRRVLQRHDIATAWPKLLACLRDAP